MFYHCTVESKFFSFCKASTYCLRGILLSGQQNKITDLIFLGTRESPCIILICKTLELSSVTCWFYFSMRKWLPGSMMDCLFSLNNSQDGECPGVIDRVCSGYGGQSEGLVQVHLTKLEQSASSIRERIIHTGIIVLNAFFSLCSCKAPSHWRFMHHNKEIYFFFSLTLSSFLHFTPSFYWTVQAEDICISKLHRTSIIFKTIAVLKDSIKSLTFLMSEGTEIKSPYIELNSSNSAFKILSFHNFTHKGVQWKWFSLL